jgi:AcrR family transcriptional regulator
MNKSRKTEKTRQAFLKALAEGASVSKSAEAAGVARSAVYRWRDDDAAFKAAWVEAYEIGADTLEDEAIRRGRDGVEKPLAHQGVLTGAVVTEYSDRMLEIMLKARRPSIYRDRASVELSGPDGGPIEHKTDFSDVIGALDGSSQAQS